ncbi:MFS transporter [Humibacter sp. BT305]|nr:MFS transporter [Humibacter sp. BT305]
MSALSARSLERRFLLLTSTRWLQVGVVFGLTILLALQRGLSIAEVGVLLSVQGFVVLALELPSGSLADSLGRRPVLLLAAIAAIAATVLVVIATDFVGFALALLVQGVFRALDSGPLEAWFVDALGPDVAPARVARSLGRGSTVLGASIAVGSAGGGLLVWVGPRSGPGPARPPVPRRPRDRDRPPHPAGRPGGRAARPARSTSTAGSIG